jgi:hypothetical protein
MPTRGLRQGDLLSPYLTLFVGEIPSYILEKETDEGRLTPIKISIGAPGIYSLLFADDSLLFLKSTLEEARDADSALKLFQRCTGQLLSPSKCSLLFNNVCPLAFCEEIRSILNISSTTFEEKYLGFPTLEGKMKNGCFQPILGRFTKRLTNGMEKLMSQSAEETLVKSVAQAFPAHVMDIFKMSLGFCEQY